MTEEYLCVSYFDQKVGPSLLFCNETLTDIYGVPNFDNILGFCEDEDTILFSFRRFQTINHIFTIESKYGRGNQDLLMISYFIKASFFRDKIPDFYGYLNSKKPVLEEFSSELKKIKELPSILHNYSPKSNQFLFDLCPENFKSLFLELYKKFLDKISLHKELRILSRAEINLKKIIIFGNPKEKAEILLKNMEAIQFYNKYNNDLKTSITGMVLENTETINDNCIKSDIDCNKCKSHAGCLNNAQGLIFVIDSVLNDSLSKGRQIFHKVLNRCLAVKADLDAILIINNTIYNENTFQLEDIIDKSSLGNLTNLNLSMKHYSMNIINDDDKIMESFHWLIKSFI